MKTRAQRNRAAERRAIERAILRTLRKAYLRDDETLLNKQEVVTLYGLERARRAV